jgi:hypothetical protein
VKLLLLLLAAANEPGIEQRIAGREFPSVFQAWNPADNLKKEDKLVTLARHDLVFHGPEFFGLKWNRPQTGLSTGFTPDSIAQGLKHRKEMLERNPRTILLAEIRYRDAAKNFLPENHKFWKRTSDGKLAAGWEEGGYLQLDLANVEFQKQVALRARAAVTSGVVDGVMLDWWQDDDDRLALIRRIRAAIGDKALILVNANDRKTPGSAGFINGYFMECYRSKTPADWQRIEETLVWAEANLRAPHINCLETWYQNSRTDLNLMRATTTLALTMSDGYALFSDPNTLPTPDHLHDWYPFWNKSLGKPTGKGMKQNDGTSKREFERGVVVYNPMGNGSRTVNFKETRLSLATGTKSKIHTVQPADGDIFIVVR